MSQGSVESRVRKVVACTLGRAEDELPRDAKIKQTEGWDSLTHVQLMVALEKEFGVDIDGETILELTSLERMIRHFQKASSEKGTLSTSLPVAATAGDSRTTLDLSQFVESLGARLPELGIQPGDLLLLHSFLGSLLADRHSVDTVCEKLVEVLLEALGPHGTLVLPTFTNVFTRGGVLDRDHTPSDMGILTEYFRAFPGVRHTRHPCHRFSALGPHADELVDSDCPSAFGPGSPIHVMHRLGGKILFFSVDWETSTFLHYVEEQFEVPYRYYKDLSGTVIGPEGPRQETWQEYAGDLGHGCEESFNAFGRRVEAAGLCESEWVGPVRLKTFRMDKVFEFTYSALEENVKCLIGT